MFAKLLGWVPDADDTTLGVLVDVQDMIPSVRGYQGAPSPVSIGLPALAAECRGSASVRLLDDSSVLFAGTQTKLYMGGATSWTDVTDTTADYTGSASSRWVFAQFGNVTLACNLTDPSQYYNHGTSTDFDALSGMPKALVVESVGNFVLIGNYNDGTAYADGWGCCAIGDYTDWTPDLDTQSTYGRLTDTTGPITGLKRLQDYAIFYKRRSMYVARYVGTPTVWEFSLVSDTVGCASQNAIIKVGERHYFASEDNFYVYDTASLQPIGDEIKEWFFENCNHAKRSLMQGFNDERIGVVYWYYASKFSSTNDSWVAYNYRTGKWGKGTLSVEATLQYVYGGKTYDDLDTIYGTYAALHSTTYDGTNPTSQSTIPAIFNTSHQVQLLNGVSTSSSLTSNDFGMDGEITLVSRVRPRYLVAPTTATMTNYYRDAMGDSLTTDSTTSQDSGKFDCLRASRWHRLKLDFTGDVELTGADISIQSEGAE